jgi:hypothetical protein
MTNDEYIKKAQDLINPIIHNSAKEGEKAALYMVSAFTALLVNKLKEIDKLKGVSEDD